MVYDTIIQEADHSIINQRKLLLYEDEKYDEHIFSDNFQNETIERMQSATKQTKKYFIIGNFECSKAVILIIIILFIGTITACALWSGLIYNVFDLNTNISMGQYSSPALIEDFYLPQYLPVGFELESQEVHDTIFINNLTNKNGDILMLTQQLTSTTYNVDSEDTNWQFITISGNNGYFYVKNEHSTIIWSNQSYMFELMGFPAISSSEMKLIAESINIIEMETSK
ncbi:DUF4367 domain-containing protein [Lachnospiraceae bacterium OttesenSCG-928-D06]|nr:DUF4367 domain-containing protein [Lachnospiraceae bacterium OttesenSCG-928-D06]